MINGQNVTIFQIYTIYVFYIVEQKGGFSPAHFAFEAERSIVVVVVVESRRQLLGG